jgi:hypothetical protein
MSEYSTAEQVKAFNEKFNLLINKVSKSSSYTSEISNEFRLLQNDFFSLVLPENQYEILNDKMNSLAIALGNMAKDDYRYAASKAEFMEIAYQTTELLRKPGLFLLDLPNKIAPKIFTPIVIVACIIILAFLFIIKFKK